MPADDHSGARTALAWTWHRERPRSRVTEPEVPTGVGRPQRLPPLSSPTPDARQPDGCRPTSRLSGSLQHRAGPEVPTVSLSQWTPRPGRSGEINGPLLATGKASIAGELHPAREARVAERQSEEDLTWSKGDNQVGTRIRTIRPPASATGMAAPGRSKPEVPAKASGQVLLSPRAGTRTRPATSRSSATGTERSGQIAIAPRRKAAASG